MSESTVKREKLVNPVGLILIGLAFAIAMWLLLQNTQSSRLDRTGNDPQNTQPVFDDLDYAYLKARLSSGELSADEHDGELSSSIDAMLEAGQTDRLNSLLQEFPGIKLSRKQLHRQELEQAVASFYKVGGTPADNLETIALRNALSNAAAESDMHTPTLVRRALALSKGLQHYDLVDSWYQIAFSENKSLFEKHEKQALMRNCGEYFTAHQRYSAAIDCWQGALAMTDDSEQQFGLKLQMMPAVSLAGNPLEVDTLIEQIAGYRPKTVSQMRETAKTFLAAGRVDIAYPVYAELATVDSVNRYKWLKEASKWAAASAEPAVAAGFLQEILDSNLSKDRAEDELQVRELWIASGENEKALEQIYTRLERNPRDMAALRQGVALAQGLNLSDQAILWNEQLLAENPDDIAGIKNQASLSLAAGNLEEAARWANIAVVLEPDNIESRRRLAQVSEWVGRPEEAEQHWAWVARKSADTESFSQILRLAEMNYRPAAAADAAVMLSHLKQPTEESIEKLIKLHELDGRPGDAATAIRNVIKSNGPSAFLLARLGSLYQYHSKFTESLSVWEEFEQQYAPTTESRLARSELNWRLNKPEEAARVARELDSSDNLRDASDYHIRMLAELAWRYDEPELGALIEPSLEQLEDPATKAFFRERRIRTAIDARQYDQAFSIADKYWRETGEVSKGLNAMEAAVHMEDPTAIDTFLVDTAENVRLQRQSRYWLLAATRLTQQGKLDEANNAYQAALKIDPQDVSVIGAMLWQQIGHADDETLRSSLDKYASMAEDQTSLWSAFAVGYLRVGDATTSLLWFGRQMEGMESDYGMMLTFADALEADGQIDTAFRVRRFTLTRLRPILAAAARDGNADILRQYASQMTRYGGTEGSEEWTNYLLASDVKANPAEQFWREDVSISWLMSTQRHEQARLIMARLHEERVRQPAWQRLAMALHDNNHQEIRAVLASGETVSSGNRIIALAALGKDRRAMNLTRSMLRSRIGLSERQLAEQQYVYLRGSLPSYTNASTHTSRTNTLDVQQSGLSLRHSFLSRNLGVNLEVRRSDLSSNEFDISDSDQRNELILTLGFGGRSQGGSLTAGIVNADDTDISYTQGRYHRQNKRGDSQVAVEFGINEAATQSPALQVAALQNRASLEYETSIGSREYLRFRADAQELFTRVDEAKIARGIEARGELGTRGNFGSHNWSSSVSVASSSYSREDALPTELQLSPTSSFDSILADNFTSLAFGASLSRGGIGSDFPQVSSPRYFLNGTVAHAWPERSFGVLFEGGVGMRVVGSDELSLSFSHDSLASELGRGDANSTGFGLNYRYHFKR